MERLTERIANLTDDQLRMLTVVFLGLTAVATFIVIALFAAPGIMGSGETAIVATPTTRPIAQLPPTWTPTVAPTATATRTPRPTETALPATEDPLLQPTGTPDYPATAAAILATPTPGGPADQTPTTVPTTAPPPTVAPPTFPPVVPPPPTYPPAPTAVPTSPPPPTNTPEPTPTPLPPFIVRDFLGGPGCDGVKTFGTVYAANGSPLAGVRLRMYNNYGYAPEQVTDGSGRYEFFLRESPSPEIKGMWHWVIIENGAPVSPIISYEMTGVCGQGPHLFKLDWQKTS